MTQRDLLPQPLVEGHAKGFSIQNVQQLDDASVFDGYDPKHMLSPFF